MTNEKMTRKSALEYVISRGEKDGYPAEVLAKLNKMLETISKEHDKKSEGEKKKTEKQIANEGLKEKILELLDNGAKMSIPEISAAIPELNGVSSQKVSSLLVQLGEGTTTKAGAGLIDKEKDKGTMYFFKKNN